MFELTFLLFFSFSKNDFVQLKSFFFQTKHSYATTFSTYFLTLKVLIADFKRVNSFHPIENMHKLFNKMSMASNDAHTQRALCNVLTNDEVDISESIYIFKRLLTSCKRFCSCICKKYRFFLTDML